MLVTRILVALDHDDSAAPVASFLEANLSAPPKRFVLAGIAPKLKLSFAPQAVSGTVKAQEKALIADLTTRLNGLKTNLQARFPKADVEIELLSGATSQEITKAAILHDCDLVIKTADFTGGGRRPVFNRVETALIRRCPRAVLILPAETSKKISKIAVAIDDPGEADKPKADKTMPARLIESAVAFAKATGVNDVCLVHAWTAPAFEMLDHPRAGLSKSEVDSYLRSWERKHENYVADLSDDANVQFSSEGITFGPHIGMGAAEAVIPNILDRIGADIMVIGSANRTGIAGLFFGNTAEKILDRINTAVLVIKPEDFAAMTNP